MTTPDTSNPAAAAPFDIADYEDVASSDVIIKHPATGAPTQLVITIAGPEHPDRKRQAFDRARKMRAQLQKTGKVQLGDPVDDEADMTDQLVAFTLGWSGMVRAGQPVPYGADVARQLYTDGKLRWLRDQVVAALDEREAFIKRSATA
jgi:hypothetical protein